MAEEEQQQETESSPVSSEETQVDDSSPVEEVASSSDAEAEEKEETEESLESVVQDALQPKEETVEEPETSEEIEATEVDTPTEEASEEKPDEDFKDVPFNKHPRFRQLVAEKNELKNLNSTLQNDSVQYKKITDFMDRNKLTPEEAVNGFRLMAALKNNPEDAYDALSHYMEEVSHQTGRKLPEDLQAKVDDGFIDEEAAKELSQTRASLEREKQLRKQEFTSAQQAQSTQRSQHLENVLKSWGTNIVAKDPDFSLKQEEFNDRVVALVNERGRPQTQEQMINLVDEAYETINERFKSRLPSKKPISTATGGKLSGGPRSEPKSLHDAISIALEESAA